MLNKIMMGFIAVLVFSNMQCGSEHVRSNSYDQAESYENDEFDIDELNYYGRWVYVDGYGKVWNPNVGRSWRPFSYGEWVYDGYDWIWYSYEPYGWVVYHYGNWYHDNFYGWVWIPGRIWSKARVTWIYYDNYVGWAPLPPPGMYWNDPWVNHNYIVWNVVYVKDFANPGISRYRINQIPKSRNLSTSGINRTAPQKSFIEKQTRVRVYNVPTDKIENARTSNRLYRWNPPQEPRSRQSEYKDRLDPEIAKPVRKRDDKSNTNQNKTDERRSKRR